MRHKSDGDGCALSLVYIGALAIPGILAIGINQANSAKDFFLSWQFWVFIVYLSFTVIVFTISHHSNTTKSKPSKRKLKKGIKSLEKELEDLRIQIENAKTSLKNAQDELKLARHETYIKNEEAEAIISNAQKTVDRILADDKKTLEADRTLLHNILEEESQKYPWLANFIAEYYYLYDKDLVHYLETKKNPAKKSAEYVSEYAKESRALRRSLKEAEHQLAVYENVAPWLEDFKELPPAEVIEMLSPDDGESAEEYERLKNWLSPEEYASLGTIQKYQLALDRYEKRNKSNWEIGREYERYIGYLYESKGYLVSYVGALKGLEDMGRDLIAKKNGKVYIIQCKNWAERKTIHEKHIFQLFGSVTEYNIDHDTKAKGVFLSTCELSEKAQAVADVLKIKYSLKEFVPDYPKIKCNVSERNGEKIYHLPFDQQYDKILIEADRGECYVKTVAEAEQKGFRRAKKYIPE